MPFHRCRLLASDGIAFLNEFYPIYISWRDRGRSERCGLDDKFNIWLMRPASQSIKTRSQIGTSTDHNEIADKDARQSCSEVDVSFKIAVSGLSFRSTVYHSRTIIDDFFGRHLSTFVRIYTFLLASWDKVENCVINMLFGLYSANRNVEA